MNATLTTPEPTTESQPQTTGEPPMTEQSPVEQTTAPAEQAESPVASPVIPTKGISLWQPWATLIAIGAKHIETRSWPTDYRGPIAILATKDWKPEGVFALSNDAIKQALAEAGLTQEKIPLGGIVAVADLVDCFQFAEGFDPGEPEKHFGDFTPGRWGLKLENIHALPALLSCAGAQKIFDLPEEAIAELTKVLATPTAKPMPGALQDVPTLDWKYDQGNDLWEARSFMPEESPGHPSAFTIFKLSPSKWPVTASSPNLLPEDRPPDFDSLDAAKAWCAAREAELFNASRKKVEADPATVKAEEKVGSKTGHGDIQQHVNKIEKAERYVTECEEEWEAAKKEANEAKKSFDDAVEKLRKIIRWNSEPAPLFDQKAPQAVKKQAENITEAIPATPTPPDDDSWKSVTLEGLGIKSSRVLKALHEHNPPITTFGELSDWQNAKGDFWAKDIKGIGAEGRKEIEDAQFAYWNAHPRASSPPAEKSQEQKADGPTPLVWTEGIREGSTAVEWNAENTAGIFWDEDQHIKSALFITLAGGKYLTNTDDETIFNPDDPRPSHPTLKAAQQWCQQQNDAAWARLHSAKAEPDAQLQPGATNSEKVQPPLVYIGDLGLTEDAVRKAYYPKLLEASRGDKLPIITDTIEVDGVLHIAVTPSLMDSAAYVLIPLLGQRDDAVVTDNDRYGGIAVKRGEQTLWLGPAARSIRVSVNPVSTLPPPEAQAAADMAITAKQTGAAAIDADKAKWSKRGKKEAATV